MPLDNKYLKYQPEITLEIFDKIWNKLLSLKIKGKVYDFYPENNLEAFKKGGYIWIGPYGQYSFGIDNNHGSSKNTETSVQEILGYDPFVKEEFVLPEKWCIKVTNESFDKVKKWTKREYNISIGNYAFANNFYHYHMHGSLDLEDIEITFEQFKKYVLKESIEEPRVENKEVIPEYVECIKDSYGLTKGSIYKIDEKGFILGGVGSTHYSTVFVKPSTKEAFGAQNKPIEKWSVGSYFVIEEDRLYGISSSKRGDICIIKEDKTFNFINKKDQTNWCFDFRGGSRWFATKSEAEEFAKTLVKPVKEEVKTSQLDLNEWYDKYKKLNLAANDLANAIELSNFDKVYLNLKGNTSREKANILYNLWNPKQPLKQTVHCKTQEEWDFVSNKIGYKFTTKFELRVNDTINPALQSCECKSFYERRGEYQILSFQEWCDLNGYKMEKEVKFEVGDIVMINESELPITENWLGEGNRINKQGVFTITNIADGYIKSLDNIKCCLNKYRFRHATPEEINSHLISIGQIPAGEPLNTGIEPNKDGVFKYKSITEGFWVGSTIDNHLEVMAKSTVKPTIEFNYLPEPN